MLYFKGIKREEWVAPIPGTTMLDRLVSDRELAPNNGLIISGCKNKEGRC